MPSTTDHGPPSNDKNGDKKGEKKPEKSYLASAVESINPWTTSRSSTPTQKDNPLLPQPKSNSPPAPKADDHATNTLYGRSFKRYPADCPPLNVMWFHAVDVPKRKPEFLKPKKKREQDLPKLMAPKKFVAFSKVDTRSLEGAYQKLLEDLEIGRGEGKPRAAHMHSLSSSYRSPAVSGDNAQNTSLDSDANSPLPSVRVPVNEDFFFDVDIVQRELSPVYWLGPIYEVSILTSS